MQGPRASIDAKGEYLLETKTLDFNARVYPLQESKFVVADALGALLTPLSNVLELKLTGPLEKPSWAFAFGPTSLLRAITRPLNSGPPSPQAERRRPPAPPQTSAGINPASGPGRQRKILCPGLGAAPRLPGHRHAPPLLRCRSRLAEPRLSARQRRWS